MHGIKVTGAERRRCSTHWMPLQETQTKVQKLVHTYCGPWIRESHRHTHPENTETCMSKTSSTVDQKQQTSHGPRGNDGVTESAYESVAVDASAVGRQLEEPPHDPLVPLLLLPGRGRHSHSRLRSFGPEDLSLWIAAAPAAAPPLRIERARGPAGDLAAGSGGLPRVKSCSGTSSRSEAWEWRSACLQLGVGLRLVPCVSNRAMGKIEDARPRW
jgi:hypothetical protein